VAASVAGELSALYLVVTHEVASLYMAQKILRSLKSTGFPTNRTHLVINRVPRNPPISCADTEKMLGMPLFLSLPNDYGSLYDCYSEGHLLPNQSKLARQMEVLAARIMGQAGPPKRSLLDRLRPAPAVGSPVQLTD